MWSVAGVVWLVLGVVQIASRVFTLTPLPLPAEVVIISGCLPVALSVVWFYMAHKAVAEFWLFHLPAALGLIVIVLGSVLDPNDHSADVAYPMLPMLCAIVVFPLAHAWPYVLGAMAGSGAFVLFGDDPTPWPRTIVVCVVVLAAAGLLSIGQMQLRRALARNRQLAEVDPLTGIANVRRLRDRLAEESTRERGAARFALLAIDLDDFKAVNDEFGHSTGDRVLSEVARAIERELAPGDMVARRGGDEFSVIVAPGESRSYTDLAERIAAAIAAARADLCPSIEPAASVGLVERDPREDPDELLARADAALHERKAESHDRRGGARADAVTVAAAKDGGPAGVRPLPPAAQGVVVPWTRTHAVASWQMIAGVFAVFALIVPMMGIADPAGDLVSPVAFLTCFAAAAAAAAYLILGEPPGVAGRYAALAGTFAVAALLIWTSGGLRNATIELVTLPAMLGFYVAGRRGGTIFAIAGLGIYAYFMTTLVYDLAVIRTLQTAVVLLMLGFLVPWVTAQARSAAEENEWLSGVDPLTGLANVRRMNQRLADELSRVRTAQGYVSVLTIDLDEFKRVNDTFDHQVGDRMLVAVARAIGAGMRDVDLVARRGGDEFVAIVPHHGEIDPGELAERVARGAEAARAKICPDLNPRVSVGWFTGRPGDTAAELLARADADEKSVKQTHRRERPARNAA